MLKLSKLSDYAVIVLSSLEEFGEIPTPASVLSQKTKLPEPTVAKVLKLLAAENLVISLRGVKGGYTLARTLPQISIKDVIQAVDGPVTLTSCTDSGDGCCDYAAQCTLNGCWDHVNEAIKTALQSVSVADMRKGK